MAYAVPVGATIASGRIARLDTTGAERMPGVGEIGLAGVAAAITAAVYHATGVRVRELPVCIEDLLQSKMIEA
jgi:CO/xanthine dehydrogenase Mo-binding subunit